MRLDFVKTFLDSTTDLFCQVVGPSSVEAMAMMASPTAGGDVMAVIGLAGDAHGRVIFDLDESTVLRLASHMLGESVPGLTPLVRSSIAELASMAMGKAISRINDGGTRMVMSPPTVITGANLTSYDQCFETLVASVVTGCGTVRVNITVQDME